MIKDRLDRAERAYRDALGEHTKGLVSMFEVQARKKDVEDLRLDLMLESMQREKLFRLNIS